MKTRQARKKVKYTVVWQLENAKQARRWRSHMVRKFAPLCLSNQWMHQFLVENGAAVRRHGHDHDAIVGQCCGLVSWNKRIAKMAWCASMMHTIPRYFPAVEARMLIETFLSLIAHRFHSGEIEMIESAVMRHSKLSRERDNEITIVLKKANRLAKIMARSKVASTRGWQKRVVWELRGLGLHPLLE